MMSSRYGFKKETPQNLTLKFVEDMAIDVLESNKTIEMFQTIAIVSLKMGNLGLKAMSLKIRLTIVEREKKGLFKQMQNEQEGYDKYKKQMGGWKK